jgi:hypothetical protein
MTQDLDFVSTEENVVRFTVGGSKTVYKRKLNSDGTFKLKKHIYQVNADAIYGVSEAPIVAPAKPLEPLQSEFPINQRFGFLEKFTNMVLDGDTASIIVTGEGGLGKSHTIMEALNGRGWHNEFDYFLVKGYATPKALYATLWENRKKTLIFDDCDSVLKDPTAVNLLKGALDSYDTRTISWLSKGFIDDGLPDSFEFEGNVIFISNMKAEKIDKAIRSRSITIDLTMTMEDKLERMEFILPNILTDFSDDLKTEGLNFIKEHAEEARELNMRTLMKVIKVAHAYGEEDWYDAAKYLLTNV